MSRRLRVLALGALLAGAAGGCERAADPGAAGDTALPDAELPALYAAFESGDAPAVEAAVARVLERGDRRFVAVLIETLHASHLHQARSQAYNERVVALERLSGEHFGGDWFAWAAWYDGSELEPPPGFLGFKGRLFAAIDPELGEFLRDDLPSRLRPELIRWGGVLPRAMPALDEPARVSAGEAGALADDEPVFGVALGGEARAYPQRVLDWHPVVNDRLGGEAIAVASSPICGSTLAWRRSGADGAPHEFEVSGLLYRGNELLFDRATRTLWGQLTGRALLGPLAAQDVRLEPVPGQLTRWADWRAQHPHTTALSLETGHDRVYQLGTPYGSYTASSDLLFPVAVPDARLPARAWVFGIAREGASRAWPLPRLVAERVVNDTLGSEPLVLVATRGSLDVEAEVPGSGRLRWTAGAEVRAYRRGDARFTPGAQPDLLEDEQGRPWRVEADALVGPDGARSERVAGTLAYWFAWRAFHPETGLAETELARWSSARLRLAARRPTIGLLAEAR